MIHRITFANGAYVEWFEPGRRGACPTADEPDFDSRVVATARAFDPEWAGQSFHSRVA